LSFVSERPHPPESSATAAAAAGRDAPAHELAQRLRSAPVPYLVGALDNPGLGPIQLGLLLRNRSATPELLARVARNRGWTRHYEVKKGLVQHPRTPLAIGRALVHHLYWRDLAETADDRRAHPTVRRHCEELLKIRLLELSLGERISLARVASPGLIQSLREAGESRVLKALLGNPKLREPDAVSIADGKEVPGTVLGRLAEHPEWGRRHAVRLALVRNPRTPVPVALNLVRRFPRPELRRLAKDGRAPKIVRVGAARQLARVAGPAKPAEPGAE
jgi:hypothetical protein